MKTILEIVNEIPYGEGWIRHQEAFGKLKLKSPKVRGQIARLFDEDDVITIKDHAVRTLLKPRLPRPNPSVKEMHKRGVLVVNLINDFLAKLRKGLDESKT